MPSVTWLSRSLEETAELARVLAGALAPGDTLALHGDLGAGKTTFVRALAGALGVDPGQVSSPTYVLMNEYETGAGPALVHVDAYRVSGADEIESAGLADLAGDEIVVIEWAERIGEALPESAAHLRIEAAGGSESGRRLRLEAPESWRAREAWTHLERGPSVCPATGRWVPPDGVSWPFADERARLADLYQWFEEGYSLSRPMDERDLEEGS